MNEGRENILKALAATLMAEAECEAPREACGLILKQGEQYEMYPLQNVAENPTQAFRFHVNRAFWSRFTATGELQALYHSHPAGPSGLSHLDMVVMQKANLPMVLVAPRDRLVLVFHVEHRGARPVTV